MCFLTGNKPCAQTENCNICYEKSFANHPKSEFWSIRNESKPWQFKKQSNKKFWFKCDKSDHEFETALNNICGGKWCPFPCCGNQRLCSDENCEICFDASFASSNKAEFWSINNDLKPRNVFKNTAKKFWFKCDKSDHEFESELLSITNQGSWCPYLCCCNPLKKLCSDEDCLMCFNASFASSDKAEFWSSKNTLTPREVSKSNGSKYWFKCKNGHDFEITLHNVTQQNSWCAKCTLWQNQIECIQIIEQITDKEFKQCKPKFMNKLELDGYNTKLQLAIEYNGIQHYKYHEFFHGGKQENLVKQQERDKIKQELCNKNNVYLIVVPYWVVDKKELIQKEYENYLTITGNS
jgi:hypothetical protein